MAIEQHVHEYYIFIEVVDDQAAPDHGARCKHPECDHELNSQEVISYLNWVEKYKDGLSQIGADF